MEWKVLLDTSMSLGLGLGSEALVTIFLESFMEWEVSYLDGESLPLEFEGKVKCLGKMVSEGVELRELLQVEEP